MMDEKERNESMPREQQSHNVFAKLWRLFKRVLSWLLILPILFYRQFISPLRHLLVASLLLVRSMVDKLS